MEELREHVRAFRPDLLMIRTLTYYKDFFVDVIAELRKLFLRVPIVAGGPHPTIDPDDCFCRGGDVCVIGKGEIICGELVAHILQDGYFPDMETLKGIKGIAFLEHERGVQATGMQTEEAPADYVRAIRCGWQGANRKDEGTYACYPLWVRAGTEKAVSR